MYLLLYFSTASWIIDVLLPPMSFKVTIYHILTKLMATKTAPGQYCSDTFTSFCSAHLSKNRKGHSSPNSTH